MNQVMMMMLHQPPFTLCFILTIFIIPVMSDLEGPNICEKNEMFHVTVTKQIPTPYQVQTTELCSRPPFRCKKTKTVYKPENVDVVHTTNKTIKICCEGYAQVGNNCVPLNSNDRISSNLVQQLPPLQAADAGNSPGIWIGTSLTLLLVVAVFMLLLFRYKKKLHSVKEELNYVTYTVERGSSCGSSANYAVPSESGCSGLSVTPNVKSNNLVHVVNQLKSDPTKVSNIEKAAALKKQLELENDYPCKGGATSMSPTSSKQLFKPMANPNVYLSTTSVKSDKEPIYEELPDTPAIKHSYSYSSTSDESEIDVNDLSGSSMYDRPRALNSFNITPPNKIGETSVSNINSPSENGSLDTSSPAAASASGIVPSSSSSQSVTGQSTLCQASLPIPIRPAPMAPNTVTNITDTTNSEIAKDDDTLYTNLGKEDSLYSNQV